MFSIYTKVYIWHLTNKSQRNFNASQNSLARVITNTGQNINTSHQHSKNYTGFLSNKESTTKPVFSHTKHLQINNLHIFTIVFHSRHIAVSTRSSDSLVLSIPYVRSSTKRAPTRFNRCPGFISWSFACQTFRSCVRLLIVCYPFFFHLYFNSFILFISFKHSSLSIDKAYISNRHRMKSNGWAHTTGLLFS